jgi:hypothetical protein
MSKKIHNSDSRWLRFRYVGLALALVVLGSGSTVYGLYIHQQALMQQQKVVQKTPVAITTSAPVVQPTTPPSTPTTITKPTPTLPKKTVVTTTTPAPVTSTPSPVVTPVPTSQVSTLTSKPTTPPTSTTKTGQTSASTTTYTSTNWSGYMATSGSFTSVSGSWKATVPTNTDTTNGSADGTWVGIGGVTSSDLIQVGTENMISPTGIVSTNAFYELLPDSAYLLSGFIVTPGDTVRASVTQSATSQWIISITNVTTTQTYSKTLSYTSSLSTAEWIQEDPSYVNGSLVPLDNFGTAFFNSGTTVVDGNSLSIAAANASQITMTNSKGTPVAVPTSVTDGIFSVSYQ